MTTADTAPGRYRIAEIAELSGFSPSTLSGDDMGQHIEDWRNVLGDVARRLRCPFFSFAITIDQRGLALDVTAPTDGQDLLATVFGDNA